MFNVLVSSYLSKECIQPEKFRKIEHLGLNIIFLLNIILVPLYFLLTDGNSFEWCKLRLVAKLCFSTLIHCYLTETIFIMLHLSCWIRRNPSSTC